MKRRPMPRGVTGDARGGALATREYQPGELGAALSPALETRQHRVSIDAIEPPTRPLRRPPSPPPAAVETRVDVTAAVADAPADRSSLPAKLREVAGRPIVRMAVLGLACVALGAGGSRALIPHPAAPSSQVLVDGGDAGRADATASPASAGFGAGQPRDESATRTVTAQTTVAVTDAVDGADATSDAVTDVEPVTPARASRLLAAGNVRDARDAYRHLADRYPGRPVYAVLARVLQDCERTVAPQDGRPRCQL